MFPLYMAKPSEIVQVICIEGGRGIRKKLMDVGIVPKVTVRVISSGERYPTIVEKDGMRLILGYGASKKIYVSPISGGE